MRRVTDLIGRRIDEVIEKLRRCRELPISEALLRCISECRDMLDDVEDAILGAEQ